MNVDEETPPKMSERVLSGIPGLDAILQGGFLQGGVYLIQAQPGAGKTILGNQVAFRHVQSGGRAVVITLLTESHSRLLGHLATLGFFDASCVGSTLFYVSAYQTLESAKLKGLLAALRKIVREHKATLLVIDGMVTAGAMAESEVEMKKFIHELQVFVELIGCTTLLLTGTGTSMEQYAFRTMVDGLVELHLDTFGMEAVRTIEVPKFRGSKTLLGRHLFEITTAAGITVYPRTESYRGKQVGHPEPRSEPLATFGIAVLDEMLGGGLRAGTSTMILGAPGTGKTLLGLELLATGAQRGEAGLYCGFFELPEELRRKARTVGMGSLEAAPIEFMWHPPFDQNADALAEKVLTAVRKRQVKRVFIDGLGGFVNSLGYPERSKQFFGAFGSELRSLGAVTVVSHGTLDAGQVALPGSGLTAMFDNIIALRQIERGSRFEKLISVVKTREAGGDSSVREFAIDHRGFTISSNGEGVALPPEMPSDEGPTRQ